MSDPIIQELQIWKRNGDTSPFLYQVTGFHKKKGRAIWVDLECFHQDDPDEKTVCCMHISPNLLLKDYHDVTDR